MSRPARSLVVVAVALGAFLALGGAGAAAGGPTAQPDERAAGAVERVLVFSLPGATWDLVARERPPHLTALLERSAVASMSTRTIGARTDAGEGYVTIGAGNRASAPRAFAGLAFDGNAGYEEGEVSQVFARRAGVLAVGEVFHLGIAPVIDLNDGFLYGATPGMLGTALGDAGRSAAVVANADGAVPGGQDALHREASLAVMDRFGRVGGGTVGVHLLTEDPRFPFGLRMDVEEAVAAFDAAWADHDVVLLEASDLFRADRYTAYATREAEVEARRLAMAAADELLGRVLAAVDSDRHLVIVLAPMPSVGPAELAVAAITGPGLEAGTARSSSTRRDGYVTLPDVAPTILDALDIEIPTEMTGGIMRSAGGDSSLDTRIETLLDQNDRAVFRDTAVVAVSIAFIVLQGLAYALAAIALTVRRTELRPWARGLALVTLAIPPLTYLSGLLPYHELGGLAGYLALLLTAALALAAASHAVEGAVAERVGRARPLVAPLVPIGLTVVVLLVDVVTGGRLQINTVFGYSPIVAGRFAGFGNQAFALLAVTALLLTAGTWALWRRGAGGRAGRGAVLGTAAFLAVVVVADGHPSLGSDVGGVLALVPAAAVLLLMLTGTRLTWRRAAVVAAGAILLVGAFAAIDLARPADARTHLGRFVAGGAEGGWDEIGTVIARKANSNVSVLLSSVWSWAIPLMLLFLAFLTWRETGLLRPVLRRVPAVRAGLAGVLVAAVIGFAVNDSGVAVPTMMLGVLLPFLAILVVRRAELGAQG